MPEGGVPERGKGATGGVGATGGCAGGVVPEGGESGPGGRISQHALRQNPPPCEQNDRQVQKYYLGHNFAAAGKYWFML